MAAAAAVTAAAVAGAGDRSPGAGPKAGAPQAWGRPPGDYAAFQPVLQPALSLGMHSILRDRVKSFDRDALLIEARGLFAERPRTFTEVRAALLELYPDADERA